MINIFLPDSKGNGIKPGTVQFSSDWDNFGPVFTAVWLHAFGISLDDWQVWLLRRIMETFPPGHERAGELRHRSVVVSVGRQNGKTELGAILGLWGLLRGQNRTTVGIASSADQARLVYERVMKAINLTPELSGLFKRVTGTRGMETTTGSTYNTKPAKSAALQGIPIHTGIVDEVHIVKPELWSDLINGTGARPNAIIVGITTAGSEESELLKTLYENGEKAIAGEPGYERFGFFCWQAPESSVPEDDDELLALLKYANPRLAAGLVDPAIFVSDVRTTVGGKGAIVRYRLNRFVASVDSFLELEAWSKCARPLGEDFPTTSRPVFVVDISPDRNFASIAAGVKVDGITHVELVVSLPRPTIETLTRICIELYRWSPVTFAMDNFGSKELAEALTARGYPVHKLSLGDAVNSAAHFYNLVNSGTLRHGSEPLLSVQIPRTMRKDKGDGRFRINPKLIGQDVDAVLATVGAAWMAETADDSGFIGVF